MGGMVDEPSSERQEHVVSAIGQSGGNAGIFIYSVGTNKTDDGGVTNAKAKQDDIGLGVAPNPAEQGL